MIYSLGRYTRQGYENLWNATPEYGVPWGYIASL